MGQSGLLMIFLYPDYEVNEANVMWSDVSYTDPLTVEYLIGGGNKHKLVAHLIYRCYIAIAYVG